MKVPVWKAGLGGAFLMGLALFLVPMRSSGGCQPCELISAESALLVYSLADSSIQIQRCHLATEFTCLEATLKSAEGDLYSYCRFAGGELGGEPCLRETGIGVCVAAENPRIQRVFYGGGASPWTLTTARGACDAAGGRFE